MSIKNRINLISENENLSINTMPSSSKVEISGLCTMNCKVCSHYFIEECGERQKLISENDFILIIDSLGKFSTIKEVGLFWIGESGLHPLLDIFYKILKEKKYFTFLTTNGTISENILRAIPYIDSLKVSWNYKNENDFEKKTRRDKKLYFEIIDNISLFYKECHKYNKILTISTLYDSAENEYENSISKLNYDEHYWLPVQTMGGAYPSGLGGVTGEYYNQVNPVPCWSLFKGLYIDSETNVRCCCYGYSKEHIIGNLKKMNIEDILKSNQLKILKTQHLKNIIPEKCKKCLNK